MRDMKQSDNKEHAAFHVDVRVLSKAPFPSFLAKTRLQQLVKRFLR